MRKVVLSILTLGTFSFGAPLIHGEVSVGAMSHDPSGYIQYPADTGTQIDLERDLGLDKTTRPFARLKLELPIIPNIYLQYLPMKFDGTNKIPVEITYGDTTFTQDALVNTSVKVDHYDVALYYNLPFVGLLTNGLLDGELGLNVRVVDFDGKIRGEVNNQVVEEAKTATVPIPMVYGGLSFNISRVSLIGEIRWISAEGNYLYDLTGEARLKLLPLLFVGAGYRYEKLKLSDVQDVSANIEIQSVFASVGLTF